MNPTFFEKSKEIANNYLQSIVFLDDKAFENDVSPAHTRNNQHAFDSSEISKVFAKEQKICAVYKPVIESDIEDFKQISQKADVVILDWLITLQKTENENLDLASDAESDDPRGQYTRQIIKESIEQPKNDGLKLIIVYTGEDILEEIAEQIYTDIYQKNKTFSLDLSNCEVHSENIKILVRGKSNGYDEDRYKQRPHLLNKILTYANLPTFVLTEFAQMTSGLLSNFALFSLSTIRNNSHKILSLFSKDLDPAYLSHKSLLPHSEDAEQILHHIFKDSIGDLLFYRNVSGILSPELINYWIDEQIKDEKLSVRNKKGIKLNPEIHFQRNKELLNALLFSEETDVEKKFRMVFKAIIPNQQQEQFLSYLSNSSTMLFLNSQESAKEDNFNEKFAKLTHHKSLFLPSNTPPILTLGTIIKSLGKDDYYICIQQKCDSLRIKKNKDRKFLFLPLSKISDGSKFDLIVQDGIKLKLNKKSFALKTMIFKCNSDKEVIIGNPNIDTQYIFENIYNEKFEWVLDIKDLHAQRIVTDYVSQLSRVGLDESEWLRRAHD